MGLTDADFAFWADLQLGPPLKVFYSPMVTTEARDRNVFGKQWPAHIATAEEVERRQSNVDAVRHIRQAARKLPRLSVLVFESEQHHVGGFGGSLHADAVAKLNAWLDVLARSVRFNTEVHYLEMTMGGPRGRSIPSRTWLYPK